MTGCDIISANLRGLPQHGLPFDIAIAGDAGIGCSAAQILADEIAFHPVLEDFSEIAHIVRNFQRRRHAPCIVHRTLAAAAAVPLDSAGIGAVPYLHGDADYLISLIFQKHSRDRRIHSAGHADYNPLFHFENPCCLLSGSRGQNARMGILPIRDIGTAERNTTSAL